MSHGTYDAWKAKFGRRAGVSAGAGAHANCLGSAHAGQSPPRLSGNKRMPSLLAYETSAIVELFQVARLVIMCKGCSLAWPVRFDRICFDPDSGSSIAQGFGISIPIGGLGGEPYSGVTDARGVQFGQGV
jgi:hypothetical protein